MINLPFSPFARRNFVVEPLSAADCPHLHQIHVQTFRHAWSEEDFYALLGQETAFGFIARQEGRPGSAAGFVLARLVVDEAEILTIAVPPAFQKQGVGRALMDAALRHLHGQRARTLFLEVDQANVAAQALYRRLGFAKVGDRAAYYETGEGRSAALILRRDLGSDQAPDQDPDRK
ncbi:ribosomal-protein-alanine N-acetyltransferase [Phyllobacterium salinisoli]|uniref:Ribosomal-protein-alanine N-acetyltransferase n=1 Tax=Phyllobacterium salinisoli TaxID=1899321 RepID=A0A368K751_9HYPH|nr:ribosomal protein S18-alanine N-acetyltransferase [Phyllobacterium salinisoli]RCS25051.1 ribosomal-protein-alanine N-acetyltransferase [Phyllobacterium salinisoli]